MATDEPWRNVCEGGFEGSTNFTTKTLSKSKGNGSAASKNISQIRETGSEDEGMSQW